MKCPLCGIDYSETEAVACRGCPLARSCALLRCPNCGYEVPAPTSHKPGARRERSQGTTSGLVKAIRKWRRSKPTAVKER